MQMHFERKKIPDIKSGERMNLPLEIYIHYSKVTATVMIIDCTLS